MKTIKLFLAWLDWSTYARTAENSYKSNYKFPVSICMLGWRTLFSIFALPITWITHIWNLAFVSMDTFRKEDSDDHKLNVWNTLLFTVVSLIFGTGIHSITDGRIGKPGGLGWDWFHVSDPILLSYLKLIGAGILGAIILAIVIAIVILIFYVIHLGFVKIKKPVTESAVSKTVHAIKNKYCPSLDWSQIRKNNDR